LTKPPLLAASSFAVSGLDSAVTATFLRARLLLAALLLVPFSLEVLMSLTLFSYYWRPAEPVDFGTSEWAKCEGLQVNNLGLYPLNLRKYYR
jgi:hypothetical protein